MTSFVIGINSGGTRTSLIAADRDLNVLARVETGPGNFHNIGLEATRETFRAAITDLIAQGGLNTSALIGLGAGLAGLDRSADRQTFSAIFESLCPGVPLTIDNDAMIALIAGAGQRFGVVTISGTGSIALGVNAHGAQARAGGWGYRVDAGSGYAIGLEIVGTIARAHDGAIPATALTERILTRLGLDAPFDLINWLYLSERTVTHIAALAAEAIALEATDLAAIRILVHAADGLAEDAITVARRLDYGGQPFPLVLSGGLFTHSALLRDRVIGAVQSIFPNAVAHAEAHDPALGAAIMVLQMLGSTPTAERAIAETPVRRATEQRNRLTLNIAQRPTLDLVTLMNVEDERIAAAIAPELPMIAALIDAIAERFMAGGRLLMIGAGTSGRLAVLDAVECRPTFGVTTEQVIGIIAGGSEALTGAVEGMEDSAEQGVSALIGLNVSTADSVIGIAASGATPYVQAALREAAARGALTGSIVNVANAPISALSQFPISVSVGAEVIMGSTRLRAGTAQKLILNMITTGVMVRAGRTFGNLMTDMQASNIKLRGRAQVIVAEATGLPLAAAAELLTHCNGEIKTAIAAELLHIVPDQAREQLATVNGDLNRLISSKS